MQKSVYVIPDTTLLLSHTDYEYPLMIRDLPHDEKPREKLLAHGPEALSVRELAVVLMVTGTSKEGILDMAGRLVKDYGEKNIFAERDASRLSRDMGLPLVKACQIVACGELGRRLYGGNSDGGFTTIRTARDVFDHVSDMRGLTKEHLRGLYLNSHNRVIRDEVISIGTVNANLIHAREVFRTAIECNAVAIILVHNHPSGEAGASAEDIAVTESLVKAGKIVGIRILDHVIVTKDGFSSVLADYN